MEMHMLVLTASILNRSVVTCGTSGVQYSIFTWHKCVFACIYIGYPSPKSGTAPFYRYYNSGTGDHFYTTNFSELGGGSAGYVSEGKL